MSEVYSNCKFCGQSFLSDVGSIEDNEVAAILQCDCNEAKVFARKYKTLENAKISIDNIFGENIPIDEQKKGIYPVNDSVLDFIHTIPSLIINGNIEQISVKIDFRTKLTMKGGTKTAMSICRENKSRTDSDV